MPKPKKEKQPVSSEEKIKKEDSLLASFVQRALPTDEEVEKFDHYAAAEARDGRIEESLAEIYQNDDGEAIDVGHLDIKRGRGAFFWLSFYFLFFSFLGAGGWLGYKYFYVLSGSDPTAMKLEIVSPENIVLGEEFFYEVKLRNLSNVNTREAELEVKYPDGFIFLDSSVLPERGQNFWSLGDLAAKTSKEIKIKGKILAPLDSDPMFLAAASYTPENFSSRFKKEAARSVNVARLGVKFEIGEKKSVLPGEKTELAVVYRLEESNYLRNFRVKIAKQENLEFLEPAEEGKEAFSSDNEYAYWEQGEIAIGQDEEKELLLGLKFLEKKSDLEEIELIFECREGDKYYEFLKKKVKIEIIKNDLNLTLIANGAREGQAADLGETLNYSLVYANKGEADMEEVIIMAVLDGELLDFKSLTDENNGRVSGNTISWTKSEIPALAKVAPGDQGVLDFSLKIMAADKFALAQPFSSFEIKSYAYFTFKGSGPEATDDKKSNVITTSVNSDLSLEEEIKYFNDDNIAVGSGPIPPKVAQTTSYKVYWRITNNLHELNNLKVETKLPANVSWAGRESSQAGSLSYNQSEHAVFWDAGRLPLGVNELTAEFGVSVTPAESDFNKIMVLVSGTTVSARDNATGADIQKSMSAKTTKLVADEILRGEDGMVVK